MTQPNSPFKKTIFAAFLICSMLSQWVVPSFALERPTVKSTPTSASGSAIGSSPASPQQYSLPNGLRIVLLEDHSFPLITCQVWYRVGARNESPGLTGLSHILEHLLFQTVGHFRKGELGATVVRSGGQFNGFTSDDFTSFFENLPPSRLDLALKIESERMRGATFTQADLTEEVSRVKAELDENSKDQSFVLSREMRATAFVQHPYRNPVVGWRNDLNSITLKEAREFYDRFFHPNNATLVIVGDFKTATALPMIGKYFGNIPKSPSAIPTVKIAEDNQLAERRVLLHGAGKKDEVQIVYHAPAFADPDSAAVYVLEKLLNAAVSGRLRSKLTDTKICGSARSAFEIKKDPGLFVITLTGPAGSGPQKMLDGWDGLASQLRSTPIAEPELSRARAQAEFAVVSDRDGPYRLAFHLGYCDTMQSWLAGWNATERIRRVTSNDVLRVCKKYLGPENRVVGFLASPPKTQAAPQAPITPAPRPSAGPSKPQSNTASERNEQTISSAFGNAKLWGYKKSDQAVIAAGNADDGAHHGLSPDSLNPGDAGNVSNASNASNASNPSSASSASSASDSSKSTGSPDSTGSADSTGSTASNDSADTMETAGSASKAGSSSEPSASSMSRSTSSTATPSPSKSPYASSSAPPSTSPSASTTGRTSTAGTSITSSNPGTPTTTTSSTGTSKTTTTTTTKSEPKPNTESRNSLEAKGTAEPKGAAEPRTAATMPTLHKKVLRNGMTVVVLESHLDPIVQIAGEVQAGSVFEPADKKGLVGLLVQLLNDGPAKTTYHDLAQQQEDIGLIPSAMVHFEEGTEGISFQTRCLSRDFGKQMALIANSIKGVSTEENDIEKAKNDFFAYLKSSEDQAKTKVSRVLLRSMVAPSSSYYPADPNERVKDASAIKASDLKEFQSQHLRPEATTIVVAGDITPEAAFGQMERAFDGWAAGAREPAKLPNAIANPRTILKANIAVPNEKGKALLTIGKLMKTQSEEKDFASLLIADCALTNHPIFSRLAQRITSDPMLSSTLAPEDIESRFSALSDVVTWSLTMPVDPRQVARTTATIQTELKKFAHTGITAEELAEVKRFLTNALPLRMIPSAADGARRILAEYRLQKPDLEIPGHLINRIRTTDLTTVNNFIRNEFKPDQSVLILAGETNDGGIHKKPAAD